MNIREFAALCGVAHSTVSRVLNLPREKARTSKATYERIRAKAAEVGFQVNYYAQALHSKNSNCLGLIIGGWMPLLTEPLLYGLSHRLDMHEKHLAVLTCDATPESEADAFEKMLIYNAETVLYIPARQKGEIYSSGHIRKILEKHPQYPPVIALYGGCDIPEFYHVGFQAYEIGRRAALRQLKKGCRKFGIIQTLYSSFMYREIARGYREALSADGVADSNIRELIFWSEGFSSVPFERLQNVEGVWCGHYVLLLHCAPRLAKAVGDCKRLHVDTICGVETQELYHNLQPFTEDCVRRGDFPHWFGSMTICQYSARDIGVKAAEITIQLSQKNAEEVPKTVNLELTSVSFE